MVGRGRGLLASRRRRWCVLGRLSGGSTVSPCLNAPIAMGYVDDGVAVGKNGHAS